jgi:hypothetical protein
VDRDQIRIGDMSEDHTHGPTPDTGVGEERLVELLFGEVEHSAVEVLNPAAEAAHEFRERELLKGLDGSDGSEPWE